MFYAVVDFVVQISLMLSSSLVVVITARLATITRPMRSVRLTSVASNVAVVVVTAVVSRAFTAPRRNFAEPNVIGEMTVAGGGLLQSTLLSNDVIIVVVVVDWLKHHSSSPWFLYVL